MNGDVKTSDLRAQSATIQVIAMLALHGPQRTRDVAARLPWFTARKVSSSLSNASLQDFASRTGAIWRITFDGRRHVRDRMGVSIAAADRPQQKELPPLPPIKAEECRPWAAACASRYGR